MQDETLLAARALVQQGTGLHMQSRLTEALASYDRAISLAPDSAQAHIKRAVVLRDMGRFSDALADVDRALTIGPGLARAHFARGMLLAELHLLDEALSSFEHALQIDPVYADAHTAKAELLLLRGDYRQGWMLYEWRWKSSMKKPNPLMDRYPLWTGAQSVAGKSVLIHPELGLGDSIMFVRFAPELKRLGAKVVIYARTPLASLFAAMDDEFQVIEKGQPLPPVDLQCPIMSLPRAFGTLLQSIPADVPYLKVPPAKSEHWRAKLGPSPKLRVGLMWSGKGVRNIDTDPLKARSMTFEAIQPLLGLDCEFHSLQKELPPDVSARVADQGRIAQHQDELHDFSDTAGLVQQMDLVITIDTSVAHLAGGLGRPVWVVLPRSSDYRWMEEGDKTPWYPTARLFRQSPTAHWPEVVESVRAELEGLVAKGRGAA